MLADLKLAAALSGDFTGISDSELLTLRAKLRAEMRKRSIADSVGSIGEHLVIETYRSTKGLPKLQPAPTGTKNVDALSRNGDRFSIKTVCDAKKTGTIYPDANDRNKQLFEFLLIVRLNDDWTLKSVHQLDWPQFVKIRAWDKRMSAWYVPITSRTLKTALLIWSSAD